MSCSIPTMETDSRGEMMSAGPRARCRRRELLRRFGSSSEPHSPFRSRLDVCLEGRWKPFCWNSTQGDIASSIGVGGFGVPGALPLSTWISFQTFVRCPKEGMSSSRRSSNLSVIRIAPEISFSSNFSTIDGSKPASYIHLATWRGVQSATSFKFMFSTASVRELKWR